MFSKTGPFWIYPLPDLSSKTASEVADIFHNIASITLEDYTMSPNSDIWKIRYSNHTFLIVNDSENGCELRAITKESLKDGENLVSLFIKP